MADQALVKPTLSKLSATPYSKKILTLKFFTLQSQTFIQTLFLLFKKVKVKSLIVNSKN